MKNVIKITLLLCFLAVAINLPAATRVAIVSKASGELEDLLTVELSKIPDIELLERKEIRKVLKEQKVVADVINFQQAFALGKILKTDLFIVIQKDKKKKPIGLIIFDAHTGIRYWDSAFPDEELEKTAKFGTDAIKQALDKRKIAQDGKLKYISLLSVRNADLPREKDPYCRAVGILLMRQLGNSANFAALERSHLDWLNKERNLSGMEWSNKLLSSNILLELEVAKGKEETVQFTLILPDKQSLKVIGNLEKSAKLANELAAKFADDKDILKHKITVQAEVKRLLNEYNILFKHKKYIQALYVIQAAYALSPKALVSKYINGTITGAHEVLHPGRVNRSQSIKPTNDILKKSIDIAEPALILLEATQKNSPGKTFFYGINVGNYFQKLCQIRNFSSYPKETQAKVQNIHSRYMKYHFTNERRLHIKNDAFQITDKTSFNRYSNYVRSCISENYKLSMNQWIESCFPIIDEWLKQMTVYIEKNGAKKLSYQENQSLNSILEMMMKDIIKSQFLANLTNTELSKFKTLFLKMEHHPISNINVAGSLGLQFCQKKYDLSNTDVWKTITVPFVNLVKGKIAAFPNGKNNISTKTLCYNLAREVIANTPAKGYQQKMKWTVDLYEFATKRNELNYMLTFFALSYCKIQKDYQKALQIIDTSIKMCDSNKTALIAMSHFGRSDGTVKTDLKILKEELLSKRQSILAFLPKNENEQQSHLPWTKIVPLFNAYSEKDGLLAVVAPVIKDNVIYATGLGQKSQNKYMQLITMDLAGNNLNKYAKINSHWVPQFCIRSLFSVQAAALNKKHYIAGTNNNGILIFPLSKEKAQNISSSNGLPADYVQSLACLNGVLYAALGETRKESFIISYELKTKKMNLLASSQRLKQLSPFDNISDPFYICSMITDAPRDRLLMLLSFQTGVDPRKLSGLWDYNIKTKKWKQLQKIPFAFNQNMLKSKGKILIYSQSWCFKFDQKTNKSELIYARNENFTKIIPGKSSLIGSKQNIAPPFISTKNWLFSANPFSCISLNNGKYKLLPFINEQDEFQPIPVFEKVQSNNLLIGDGKSLFLIKFKGSNK